MSSQSIPRITPEEYLARDRAAEVRSEYYDGQMYSMAGGTYIHGRLTVNLAIAFGLALRGGPCVCTSSDVRLPVSERAYVYPDLMVICGDARFAHDERDTVTNPAAIVEVLSRTSEAHDRGSRSTPPFQHSRSTSSSRSGRSESKFCAASPKGSGC